MAHQSRSLPPCCRPAPVSPCIVLRPYTLDNNSNQTSHHNLPNGLVSGGGLNFPVIERRLPKGRVIKVKRYVDRPGVDFSDSITFRSKVVSRQHGELWAENGHVYFKDTRSSSGTFINGTRICAAGEESQPVLLKDGDVIQLGIDYQGRTEDIFHCVRIRIEINRKQPNVASSSFCRQVMRVYRALASVNYDQESETAAATVTAATAVAAAAAAASTPSSQSQSQSQPQPQPNVTASKAFDTRLCNCSNSSSSKSSSASRRNSRNESVSDLSEENMGAGSSDEENVGSSQSGYSDQRLAGFAECCICLCQITPFQAIFVSPCCHSFHYKCCRPLLQNYPNFSCPMCRYFADLNSSIGIDDISAILEELDVSQNPSAATLRKNTCSNSSISANSNRPSASPTQRVLDHGRLASPKSADAVESAIRPSALDAQRLGDVGESTGKADADLKAKNVASGKDPSTCSDLLTPVDKQSEAISNAGINVNNNFAPKTVRNQSGASSPSSSSSFLTSSVSCNSQPESPR